MAAVAQAQRQEAVTQQESLELCKALLRVSIYHVSYLRGIFPEDNFKPVDMRNLDNMEIRMLLAKNAESQRLVNWVEGGVADALKRRYLRKLFYGISRDREGHDLLEEYVFTFSYDADGAVHMAAGGGGGRGGRFSTKDGAASSKGPALNAVKYQVCRLMRMLVEITNTLEQVPDERYLFMKLTYTDDTPDEYEPPMFAPAADGGVGCFARMPFSMEVGKVDTKHIKVGLCVKTVLDHVEEGWEDGGLHVPVADDNSSLFLETAALGGGGSSRSPASSARPCTSAGGFSCAGGGRSSAKPGGAAEVKQPKVDDMAESAGSPPAASAQRPPAEAVEALALGAVRTWVLGRPVAEVHLVDALARFATVDTPLLEACFSALRGEGLLLPTGQPDCFQVAKDAPAVQRQQAAAEAAALQAMQALTVAPMDSCQGGLHDVGGSQRTMSCTGGKRKAAAPQRAESEAPAQHFPDTQQASQAGAGPGARARAAKASIVEEPIDQTAKRQRRGAAKKASAPAAAPADGTRRRTRGAK